MPNNKITEMKKLADIALITIFLTCTINPAWSQKKNWGDDFLGDVEIVGRKDRILKLSIHRGEDYSAKYNGKPSKTITYIDCKKYLIKDTRWHTSFTHIDRQSPGVGYVGAFCR